MNTTTYNDASINNNTVDEYLEGTAVEEDTCEFKRASSLGSILGIWQVPFASGLPPFRPFIQKYMSTLASDGNSDTLNGEAMYSVAVGARRPESPVYVNPLPEKRFENVPIQLCTKNARNH